MHQIVNSMLDVARLENQVLTPHMEPLSIAPILRLLQKEFQKDLETRNITLELDEDLSNLPSIKVDPELLQKALNTAKTENAELQARVKELEARLAELEPAQEQAAEEEAAA